VIASQGVAWTSIAFLAWVNNLVSTRLQDAASTATISGYIIAIVADLSLDRVDDAIAARFVRLAVGATTIAGDDVAVIADLSLGEIDDAVSAPSKRNARGLVGSTDLSGAAAQAGHLTQVRRGAKEAGTGRDGRGGRREDSSADPGDPKVMLGFDQVHMASAQRFTLTAIPKPPADRVGDTTTAGELEARSSSTCGRFRYRSSTPAAITEPPAM